MADAAAAAAWQPLNWKTLEHVVQAGRVTVEGAPRVAYSARSTHPLFLAAARYLHDSGARLLTLAAAHGDGNELEADIKAGATSASPPLNEVVLTYSFEVGKHGSVVLRVNTEQQGIDSLFSFFSCADFLEREVNGLFGVKFFGHPNLSNVAGPAPREELPP